MLVIRALQAPSRTPLPARPFFLSRVSVFATRADLCARASFRLFAFVKTGCEISRDETRGDTETTRAQIRSKKDSHRDD